MPLFYTIDLSVSGTVDAYKDLDCEVVWHPSYLAPEDGSFSLMIHGGPTLQLQCRAEVGKQTNRMKFNIKN